MRHNFFVVLLLIFASSILILANLSSAASKLGGELKGNGTKLGGYSPIKNLSDPHLVVIGKFAVSEHNKEANTKLVFTKVIKGESQVVAGINYKLVIEAKDTTHNNKVGRYEVIVWEKSWKKFMKLTSFKPVGIKV